MARAGTIEALDADYTRTAILKGLPRRTVIRRHVLRNSLLPTIAVVATQTGYLIGGLVVIELLFNYQGIGQAIVRAAQQKDIPVLQSGVLLIGDRLPRRHADRRHPLLRPEPARPPGGRRVSAPGQPAPAGATEIGTASPAAVGAHPDDARVATQERLALLRRSKSFIVGGDHRGLLGAVRDLRRAAGAEGPAGLGPDQRPAGALGGQLVRHRQARPRRLLARHRRRARHPHRRAAGRRSSPPSWARRSAWSRATSAGAVDDVLSRIIEAILALPTIIMALLVIVALGPVDGPRSSSSIGVLFAPIISRTVRAAVLRRARARVRRRRPAAQRAHAVHPVRRDPAQRDRADRRGVHGAARLRDLRRRRRSRSSASASSRPRPTGGCRCPRTTASSRGGFWWPVLFPSLAIATLVIGVNLIADGVASAFER